MVQGIDASLNLEEATVLAGILGLAAGDIPEDIWAGIITELPQCEVDLANEITKVLYNSLYAFLDIEAAVEQAKKNIEERKNE